MGVYLKNAFIDCILCILVSSALAYTACSGFYSTQPYQDLTGTLIIIAICAGVTIVLFLVSLNRMTRIVGSIVFGFVIAGLFAAAAATSTVETPMDDSSGNNLYLAFCTLMPPLVVYQLSRRKATCVLLAVFGVLLCAVIEYLYWYGHVVAFILFLVGVIALYVYRTYQKSLLNSESEHLAFMSVTAAGLTVALVAVGIGVGVFSGIIAPLEPPNMVIKLITEHYRAEEREVRGVGSSADVRNNELSTSEGDDKSQSDDAKEDEADTDDDADAGKNPLDILGLNDENSLLGSLGAGLASLTMGFPDWWPIIAVLIVIALIVSAISLKKWLRRRRLNKILDKGPDKAVEELYLFFLNRFARFKIPEPDTLTLQEYAAGFSDTFSKFEKCLGAPAFADLTRVYIGHVYGDQAIGPDELGRFTDYYRLFYKRACGYLGRLRYCRMFFFI